MTWTQLSLFGGEQLTLFTFAGSAKPTTSGARHAPPTVAELPTPPHNPKGPAMNINAARVAIVSAVAAALTMPIVAAIALHFAR